MLNVFPMRMVTRNYVAKSEHKTLVFSVYDLSPCTVTRLPSTPPYRIGVETLHWWLHPSKATPVWWGSSSRHGPLSTLLMRYNKCLKWFMLHICVPLVCKVWTAHVCSVTNAVHIHANTYHRMGGLSSTLRHRRDMRTLWSYCLRQRLTQKWERSVSNIMIWNVFMEYSG